jgi:hypothetical protein
MSGRYIIERSRPHLPGKSAAEGAERLLSWAFVDSSMRDALNYWIVSAGRDGRPHTAPVWGAWLDDTFYFEGGGRKIRNLRANPQAVVHLESGDEVVIIEGDCGEISGPERPFFQRLDEEFARKYVTYRPSGNLPSPAAQPYPDGGLFAIRPQTVFAWTDFMDDATRWRFAGD